MKEAIGDLWDYPADARVVTTNGFVKTNGAAVMGRGCALEAKTKYPGIEFILGAFLETGGNHVYLIANDPPLFSMPVKRHWNEPADMGLIVQSCYELVKKVNALGFKSIVMPRPGCGNGRLRWADVKPILSKILDDRFTVITYAGKGE